LTQARVIRRADRQVGQWRNGLGTTEEITAEPEGSGNADPFAWRISLAHIGRDCPFSPFAGYDRTFMIVEGAGVVLSFGAAAPEIRVDRRFVPHAFDGGWPTDCRLIDGPAQALNVVSDRAQATHKVALIDATAGISTASVAGKHVLAVALKGEARLSLDGAGADLAEGDCWRVDRAAGTAQIQIQAARPTRIYLVDLAVAAGAAAR
jgi:environmental stress-induced protein Ves